MLGKIIFAIALLAFIIIDCFFLARFVAKDKNFFRETINALPQKIRNVLLETIALVIASLIWILWGIDQGVSLIRQLVRRKPAPLESNEEENEEDSIPFESVFYPDYPNEEKKEIWSK